MLDITDKGHQPTAEELAEYIASPLFSTLLEHMQAQYKALVSVEYSGDKLLLGWNLRFRKGGRSLLRLYPKRGYFSVLLVIGRKEKERAEALLPEMSAAMRDIYAATPEGMGQRWLLIDLRDDGQLYQDVLALVRVRRESK